MQEEKTKRRKSKLTAYLEARDAGVWYRRLRWLLVEGAFGGIAYLLGQATMLFDTSPLGFAFLCAGKRHTVSILLGLMVSVLVNPQAHGVLLIAYPVTALIRILSGILLDAPDDRARMEEEMEAKLWSEGVGRDPFQAPPKGFFASVGRTASVLFDERVRLRMATAAIGTLIVSLYRVIDGGFLYYDWFAAVFMAIVAPAAVVVYRVYLDQRTEIKWMQTVSGALLLFSIMWASNGFYVGELSLPLMLALILTLFVSASYGTGMGVLAGGLCGAAIDLLIAPAFLIAALVFGARRARKAGNTSGVFAAVLSAVAWLLYVNGLRGFAVILFSLLTAGAIFTPIAIMLQKEQEEQIEENTDGCSVGEKSCRYSRQHQSSSENMRNISDAFSSLSEMFYNLSDRFRRPGTLDLRCLCDQAFDTYCADCPNKAVCWGLEYADTLSVVNTLINALHTKGRVSASLLPAHMSNRCHTSAAILDKINRDCARLTGDLLRNNRTEIFAMDYEAAATIINDALEEDAAEYRFDPVLEQAVYEYLRDAGVRAAGVTVYGQRRRQVFVRGADVERATVTAETLRSDLGEMCGVRLGLPSFEWEGNSSTMILQSCKKIAVLGAQKNISADGGISGDTVNLFFNKKDYFYALINDGMGSGREAALTSNLCSVFLEKMLRAGNRAETSIRMLNNMIRSRSADSVGECSSTVDLLEIDLMTANATFVKSGAAPSFILRGKTVHRLQAGTPPIGIISNLDMCGKQFELRDGDVIIMVSDGIEQNDPGCRWLVSYLSSCADTSPEEIVYNICLHASGGENHDDCSAVALRISEATEEE